MERDDQTVNWNIDLIVHDMSSKSTQDLAQKVAETAGVDINSLEITPRKIRLTAHQDKIEDLAGIDGVNRIEEVRKKVAYNGEARTILGIDAVTASEPSKYQGNGQRVCVADSGFDQGVLVDTAEIKVHPAFTDRIEHLIPIWPEFGPSDRLGHGTHVCASVSSKGVYKDQNSTENVIQGAAPLAKLMIQAMSAYNTSKEKWYLKVPTDVTELFSAAYEKGYRIHSNSWGDKWDPNLGQLGYEAEATAIDLFICKYPDFSILVAAGNDNLQIKAGPSQIGDNGAAKNCITVGACGTTRTNDGQAYDNNTVALVITGVSDTYKYGSRGPTLETRGSKNQVLTGRIKPDVVAPGVAILSAAARTIARDARMRQWYGRSADLDWMFQTGTSMATPLVAGCAAIFREALAGISIQRPSAALIKALLINGSVKRKDPQNPIFDYEQGFGRVNIEASLAMVMQQSFVDAGNKLEETAIKVPSLRDDLAQLKTWTSLEITIPEGRHQLVATLTYPDPQGALLQNNVNLIVRVGDSERHGNMDTAQGFDRKSELDPLHTGYAKSINPDNVEKVIWNDLSGVTAIIIAQANGFTKFDYEQSFAVVWDVRQLPSVFPDTVVVS